MFWRLFSGGQGVLRAKSGWTRARDQTNAMRNGVLAYFFFGLYNNCAYVLMLSAVSCVNCNMLAFLLL